MITSLLSSFPLYAELGKLGIVGVVVGVLIYLLVQSRKEVRHLLSSNEKSATDYMKHIDELTKITIETNWECSKAMTVQAEVLRSFERIIDGQRRDK